MSTAQIVKELRDLEIKEEFGWTCSKEELEDIISTFKTVVNKQQMKTVDDISQWKNHPIFTADLECKTSIGTTVKCILNSGSITFEHKYNNFMIWHVCFMGTPKDDKFKIIIKYRDIDTLRYKFFGFVGTLFEFFPVFEEYI